jgi:hypothetical protein
VPAAGRHEQADDQRTDASQERQRVLRRAAHDRLGECSVNRIGVRCSNALVIVNSMIIDEMFSAKPLMQK